MKFERLDRTQLKTVKKTAEVYRETFATEPWREVSKCPKSGSFFGPTNLPGTICPCGCNGKLEEAYPPVSTAQYIIKEISKPNAIALVAKRNDIPVGFAWGYEETGQKFAESKYKEENQQLVSELVGPDKKVFYLSECGLVETERNNRNGTQMTEILINEASKLKVPLLLRTNKKSFARKIAEVFGMKPIMGSGDTLQDPENPDRILYYRE